MLPKLHWQNKKYKYRYTRFAKKDYKNITAWQIDIWNGLFIKINRNSNRVLIIILNIHIIYIKYLNQVNHTNKSCN